MCDSNKPALNLLDIPNEVMEMCFAQCGAMEKSSLFNTCTRTRNIVSTYSKLKVDMINKDACKIHLRDLRPILSRSCFPRGDDTAIVLKFESGANLMDFLRHSGISKEMPTLELASFTNCHVPPMDFNRLPKGLEILKLNNISLMNDKWPQFFNSIQNLIKQSLTGKGRFKKLEKISVSFNESIKLSPLTFVRWVIYQWQIGPNHVQLTDDDDLMTNVYDERSAKEQAGDVMEFTEEGPYSYKEYRLADKIEFFWTPASQREGRDRGSVTIIVNYHTIDTPKDFRF